MPMTPGQHTERSLFARVLDGYDPHATACITAERLSALEFYIQHFEPCGDGSCRIHDTCYGHTLTLSEPEQVMLLRAMLALDSGPWGTFDMVRSIVGWELAEWALRVATPVKRPGGFNPGRYPRGEGELTPCP